MTWSTLIQTSLFHPEIPSPSRKIQLKACKSYCLTLLAGVWRGQLSEWLLFIFASWPREQQLWKVVAWHVNQKSRCFSHSGKWHNPYSSLFYCCHNSLPPMASFTSHDLLHACPVLLCRFTGGTSMVRLLTPCQSLVLTALRAQGCSVSEHPARDNIASRRWQCAMCCEQRVHTNSVLRRAPAMPACLACPSYGCWSQGWSSKIISCTQNKKAYCLGGMYKLAEVQESCCKSAARPLVQIGWSVASMGMHGRAHIYAALFLFKWAFHYASASDQLPWRPCARDIWALTLQTPYAGVVSYPLIHQACLVIMAN